MDDKSLLILLTVRNAARFGELSPSVKDLQKATLLSAGGVQLKINALLDEGYITRKRLARSIQVTDKGERILKENGLI